MDIEQKETVKTPLLGLTLKEMEEAVLSLGAKKFAAKQIMLWLYDRHAERIDAMTNLSKALREKLSERYTIGAMGPVTSQKSKDGTVKYLFPVGEEGKTVETVFIPDGERATLCVSSQVGCKMGCKFCQTGRQGFHGNLSARDILNQIWSLPERERLTNIVFMGQGEPLDNLGAVFQATEILTADYGFQWSPKRITVSTVGLKGRLREFVEGSPCHLAVSLHSPIAEQRESIMPAQRAMPIADIVALLRQYDFSHQRRLSFEYIVFGGFNDSPTHMRSLVRLLDGLDCRVNLIRFHDIPDTPFKRADEKTMETLRDYLTHHGIYTTIRASRGEDIYAACGLLSTSQDVERERGQAAD